MFALRILSKLLYIVQYPFFYTKESLFIQCTLLTTIFSFGNHWSARMLYYVDHSMMENYIFSRACYDCQTCHVHFVRCSSIRNFRYAFWIITISIHQNILRKLMLMDVCLWAYAFLIPIYHLLRKNWHLFDITESFSFFCYPHSFRLPVLLWSWSLYWVFTIYFYLSDQLLEPLMKPYTMLFQPCHLLCRFVNGFDV